MPRPQEMPKPTETTETRAGSSTGRQEFRQELLRNNQPQEPEASSSRRDKRTREERSPTDSAPSSPVEAPSRKKMTRQELSSKGGKSAFEQRKGMFGMTDEERREASKLAKEAKHTPDVKTVNDYASQLAGRKKKDWES
jgi:hypothetical protein